MDSVDEMAGSDGQKERALCEQPATGTDVLSACGSGTASDRGAWEYPVSGEKKESASPSLFSYIAVFHDRDGVQEFAVQAFTAADAMVIAVLRVKGYFPPLRLIDLKCSTREVVDGERFFR